MVYSAAALPLLDLPASADLVPALARRLGLVALPASRRHYLDQASRPLAVVLALLAAVSSAVEEALVGLALAAEVHLQDSEVLEAEED